jgi:hypothetical protein
MDKMACENKESKNDEEEVVETVDCRGGIFTGILGPPAHCSDVGETRSRPGVAGAQCICDGEGHALG